MSRSGPLRRALVLVAWVAGLGALAWALHAAGDGPLAGPAPADPRSWAAWLSGRDPAVAVVALLRLAALAMAWYLVGATAAGLALRLLRAHPLVALADRFTLPALRRLLAATAGVTVASGLAHGQLRLAVAAQSPPTSGPQPTLTMRLLPAESTASPVPPPAASPPPAPSAPSVAPAPATWTVRPGECFWTIAEDVLAAAWGRAPTDAEIVPYWLRLIDANRSRLGDPANPDLIWPGQIFTVPPPPLA